MSDSEEDGLLQLDLGDEDFFRYIVVPFPFFFNFYFFKQVYFVEPYFYLTKKMQNFSFYSYFVFLR